ncbi:MAG: hydroxymethylbilane synthase [Planctomycetaceae bacterium]|jgi:hydroxymethylbilane synthase|nr:hydroxymethylbilane synthase [Planctomycetaceae bacterium]
MQKIRLGTRGSALARRQADWTAAQLLIHGIETERVIIQTSGDSEQNQSIANIGAQGVFTKEIQRALLDGKIDLAVHSLKDLPTDPVAGLQLAAVTKRDTYRDAFISNRFETLDTLPERSRIGTGSLRRKTQLLHQFADRFRIDDIRGNVETRLRKLDSGDYDAVILAEAGLIRLGFAGRIRSFLEEPMFLPAAGQGALGLETRSGDDSVTKIAALLCDRETFAAVSAERAFLRTMQGGCLAPIAALGTVKDGVLTLHGRELTLDGKMCYENTQSVMLTGGTAEFITLPETLGNAVAQAVFLKKQQIGENFPEK